MAIGGGFWVAVRVWQRNDAPEIEYLNQCMDEKDLAGLYIACDCLVHPYGDEGFWLPIAEAMACGMPVIVTRGGACDHYCNEEFAFFIDGSRRPVHLAGPKLTEPGWVLEPDTKQLINRLKYIFENQDLAYQKGKLASEQIKNNLSWDKSANIILERINILRNQPICRYGPNHDGQRNLLAGGTVLKSTEEMYHEIQPLMENGWHEAAIHALRKLMESDPEFAPAHRDLGTLLCQIGDKQKALIHLEKAVQLDPNNSANQKTLADFYYAEQGKIEDALRTYKAVLKGSPDDVATLMIAGHLSVAAHNFDDAKEFYGRILLVEPGNAEAQQYLAKLMNKIEAEPKFDSAEQWYQSIQTRGSTEEPAKVIDEIEKMLLSYPEFAPAHNDLGVMYYKIGAKEKALKSYEEAVRLEPQSVIFKKNLADYYCVEQGRLEEALEIYVSVLESEPEDVETLLSLGHICIAIGKGEDARLFYNRVLEIEPWNQIASESLEQENNKEQLNSTQDSPEAMYLEIQARLNDEPPEKGISELENLLDHFPDYALAHNDLGVLYYNTDNKEKALDHYEEAFRLDPENITFRKNLADFYYVERDRVEEALKIYVSILESNPEDVETLLITGHICVSMKNFEDAKVFYNRVLEIEPWNTDARDTLEALNMARKAV